MTPNTPPIIILSAASGCGKSTVSKHITDNNLAPLERVITTTTRSPRENDGIMEVDGVDYDYITPEEFQARLDQGKFIEHVKIYKNYYGTPWHRVEEILAKGKIPLSIVEKDGSINIAEGVRGRLRAISIFLMLDPQELANRLRGRGGMKDEDIAIRLAEQQEEQRFAELYDIRLNNLDSRETANVVAQITNEMIIGRTREEICKIYDVFGGVLN